MWPQISQPVTIRRFAAQVFANGIPVVQVPLEITAIGSWQPVSTREQATTPGYSGPRSRRIFVFSEVRGVNEAEGIPADEIEVDGEVWRVVSVEPWPALWPIPLHWEASVELVQPLRPG